MDQQISLKKLIDNQDITGYSDLEIIKLWFVFNNCEQEGISIIAELSKSKTDKLERILINARSWIPILPDVIDNLKTEVNEEFAKNFSKIVNIHLLGMELNDELLEWAKDTMPKLKTPKTIFRPALEWLKNTYGIEFKDKII